MINLKLLTKGLRGVLTPSEFITLFVIESALGKTNDWKKIYNEMIADLTGLSPRQVKRNVASLVEKQFISKKTLQISRTKRECIYRLNLDKTEQKNNVSLDTSGPLNNIKRFEISENNVIPCKTIVSDKHIYNDGLPF